MTDKNNLANGYLKDVGRLIAGEWGIKFKEIKGDSLCASWFDIDPSSPLAASLKELTTHIHYSTIDSLQEIRMVWSRVVCQVALKFDP